MQTQVLLYVIGLAEHLGLYELLDKMASRIVTRSWEGHMDSLASIVQPFYKTKRDVKSLLHDPNRGAYSELQVLELLEAANVSDSDISAMLQVELMGVAEINNLLAILVNQDRIASFSLMRKAVKQHLQLQGGAIQLRDRKHFRTHIVDRVMTPDVNMPKTQLPLPHSELQLKLVWQHYQGKSVLTCHLLSM